MSKSNLWPILTMCAAAFLIAVNDAAAKWLLDRYSPLQLAFVRSLLALPLVIALAMAFGGGGRALRSADLRVHAGRGLLSILATYTFFSSLDSLPLAEATALVFSAPIVVAVLSALVFGEQVRAHRVIAVVAGFFGVLVIVRPGTDAFQPASLWALSTAVFYAVNMVSARWIHKRDNMWTMMVYMTVFPLFYSSFVIFGTWPELKAMDMAMFAVMAVFGTSGLVLLSQSFRMGPASLVAPFDYTALVWAAVLGWMIWNEVPGPWTYIGAGIIMAGGIGLILAERRKSAGGG